MSLVIQQKQQKSWIFISHNLTYNIDGVIEIDFNTNGKILCFMVNCIFNLKF